VPGTVKARPAPASARSPSLLSGLFSLVYGVSQKTNTELTREIHTLTTELHRRVIGDPAQ